MIRVGPSRLILLYSGKYDYAEIELEGPVHLVGPNNVGKTSLIAVLQFLYLDDQRAMNFSRDMQATRRYYFPETHSYVIFECLTPTGFQTVGVHGLGPLHGFEFERFAYQGRFEWDDYFDADRKARSAEEVQACLAAKGFARLEPKHLRAALTGVGDSKDIHLGLVPLRNRTHYSRFRNIFRNLLRLSHLRQEEMKSLLLDVFESEFRQRRISLSRHYAQHLERIRRDAAEVQDLRALQAEIDKLVEHYTKREGCRAKLPALWRALGAIAEAERATFKDTEARLRVSVTDAERGLETVQTRQHAAQERLTQNSGARAVLENRLAELDKQARSFSDFVREWAEARKHELDAELRRLAGQMASGAAEPAERVAKRLRDCESRIGALKTRLAAVEHAAGGLLRRQCGDDVLRDAFRILNPELLGLPVDHDRPGVRLGSVHGASAAVTGVAGKCEGRRFVHEGIEIDLDELTAPDLDRFTDPERIRTDLQSLDHERQRDEAALAAAREMDALRAREQACRHEQEELVRKLFAHTAFIETKRQEPAWRAELDRLTAAQESTRAELDRLAAERDALNARRRELSDLIRETDEARRRLEQRLRELAPPPAEWPLKEGGALPAELDDLMDRYRRAQDDESRQAERVRELLDLIESRTYGRYTDENEAVVIDRLREQVECLPEKQKAVQDLWTSIAVDLKKAFKDLKADVETLKTGVDELNRRLGQVSISNLQRLRLLVEERAEWMERIRNVTQAEDMPLFADFDASRKSMEDLGRLLSAHPEVTLDELFDLHFEVTLSDGRERRYPHLDMIESNGTTITIKVLVNLMLLHGLLEHEKIQLPFYLDEASSLDRDNLRSIVETAERLGFVAVLASPDAMEVARTIYFVEEQPNGRVNLDPETSRIRLMRTADAAQGTAPA